MIFLLSSSSVFLAFIKYLRSFCCFFFSAFNSSFSPKFLIIFPSFLSVQGSSVSLPISVNIKVLIYLINFQYNNRGFLSLYYMADFHFKVINVLIVSITEFSILIGSPRVYLSHNWRAITWVSNYSCPISTFCNWIPVIGHLRHSHVNYVHSNGFFLYCLQKVWNIPLTFSIKKRFSKTS